MATQMRNASRRFAKELLKREPTQRVGRKRLLAVRSLSSATSEGWAAPQQQLRKAGFHTASGLEQQATAQEPVMDRESMLASMNEQVQPISEDPLQVLAWAMETFEGRLAMSTSFGIQSAVLLHLATQVKPDIPVVWVDTGYLPTETYQYAQELTDTLQLNLHVASNPTWTPARMEAIHGKLWEKDEADAHALYGRMRKAEPLQAGLNALEPNPLVLLSGLRASQTKARANMPPVGFQGGRFKVLPLLRMSDEDVVTYMDKNDLPAHPLQAKGYVTVGDWHSSRPVEEGEDPRNTRFGGKFQECGLHVEEHEPVNAEAKTPEPEQPQMPIGPPSLEATNVKSLGLTRVHPETDMAVIMVKKLTEDRTYCRKCNDVSEKMEVDGITKWIGEVSVADVLDSTSEGAKLAKHFGVATAPFFLVRSRETQEKNGEWQVVRSYLQLRKMLEKQADHVIAAQEHANDDPMETDAVYRETSQNLQALKEEINKLQLELRAKADAVKASEQALKDRAQELGVSV
mmetsp:Transcript_10283/g.18120  ORF Transcript_10283/g.18120 Transcript_10283/m.18120 type:complete len:516 (-) Transcript_10283:84-1631(-)